MYIRMKHLQSTPSDRRYHYYKVKIRFMTSISLLKDIFLGNFKRLEINNIKPIVKRQFLTLLIHQQI